MRRKSFGAVVSNRDICAARNLRRAVIIANGYGGVNGFRKYRSRSKVSC